MRVPRLHLRPHAATDLFKHSTSPKLTISLWPQNVESPQQKRKNQARREHQRRDADYIGTSIGKFAEEQCERSEHVEQRRADEQPYGAGENPARPRLAEEEFVERIIEALAPLYRLDDEDHRGQEDGGHRGLAFQH